MLQRSKRIRVISIICFILILIIGSIVWINGYTSGIGFKDMSPRDEGYEAVAWAVDNGIVSGYTNGLFNPEQSVSEAEYLAMLIRAFNNGEALEETENDWAEIYYELANDYRWRVWGKKARQQVIRRVNMAVVTTDALGYNLSEDGAVQTLIDRGVWRDNVESLDEFVNTEVSRLEAVQLLYRLQETGVESLQSRPQGRTPEPVITSTLAQYTDALAELADESGYDLHIQLWAHEVGIAHRDEGIVYLNYFHEHSRDNLLVLYEADQPEHQKLAENVLLRLEVPLSPNFKEQINDAIINKRSFKQTYDDWQVILSFGVSHEHIQIRFYRQKE